MRHQVQTADAAVDPVSGYRYETRETGMASRFYRVIPKTPERTTDTGLFIMRVTGSPMANLGADYPPGITFDVEWLPANSSSDGLAEGAARFSHLEGCCYGDDARIYIVSSDSGWLGQVWAYDPLVETISLLFHPHTATAH
jgi:hypothetical protein